MSSMNQRSRPSAQEAPRGFHRPRPPRGPRVFLPCLAVWLGLLAAWGASQQAPAQERLGQGSTAPPLPGADRIRSVSGAWAMDLPKGWETLFVETLDQHPQVLPYEAKVFRPRSYYTMASMADLSRPAAERGPMLLVREYNAGAEWQLDDAVAEKIRAHWGELANDSGESYEVLEVKTVKVGTALGPDPAPTSRNSSAGPWTGWRTVRRIHAPAADGVPSRSWIAVDTDIPSGGNMLGFTFFAPEAAGASKSPSGSNPLVATADRHLATLRLARDPQGTETLGGRLQEALFWGIGMGLALVVFRSIQKAFAGSAPAGGPPAAS